MSDSRIASWMQPGGAIAGLANLGSAFIQGAERRDARWFEERKDEKKQIAATNLAKQQGIAKQKEFEYKAQTDLQDRLDKVYQFHFKDYTTRNTLTGQGIDGKETTYPKDGEADTYARNMVMDEYNKTKKAFGVRQKAFNENKANKGVKYKDTEEGRIGMANLNRFQRVAKNRGWVKPEKKGAAKGVNALGGGELSKEKPEEVSTSGSGMRGINVLSDESMSMQDALREEDAHAEQETAQEIYTPEKLIQTNKGVKALSMKGPGPDLIDAVKNHTLGDPRQEVINTKQGELDLSKITDPLDETTLTDLVRGIPLVKNDKGEMVADEKSIQKIIQYNDYLRKKVDFNAANDEKMQIYKWREEAKAKKADARRGSFWRGGYSGGGY